MSTRNEPRIEVPMSAIVRGVDTSGNRFQELATVENLSASGAFVRLPRPLMPGATVFLDVRFAHAASTAHALHVAAHARVLRVVPTERGDHGVGMVSRSARLHVPPAH